MIRYLKSCFSPHARVQLSDSITGFGVHIKDAVAEHTHTVVLLHGRGSTGEEFAEELQMMSTSTAGQVALFEHFPNVRWVFPSASPRWSTVFEQETSEWFDIASLKDINLKQELQIEGLRSSVQFVLGVIEEEIKRLGGSADKVAVGGISQGQATSLHVLLCGKHRLGAFVGASGWFPFADQVEGMNKFADVSCFLRRKLGLETVAESADVGSIPIFLGHGSDDEIVNVELGRQARDLLTGMGMKRNLVWKEYLGAELHGHWFKEPEEMDDIVHFLKLWILS